MSLYTSGQYEFVILDEAARKLGEVQLALTREARPIPIDFGALHDLPQERGARL